MIVTSDIYDILYPKVKEFFRGDVFYDWKKIGTKLKRESAVIVVSTPLEPGVYWEEAFCYVNICVPDYKGNENAYRLKEVERLLNEYLGKGFAGVYDHSGYNVRKAGIGIERDEALDCSFVSLRLLFQNLNV